MDVQGILLDDLLINFVKNVFKSVIPDPPVGLNWTVLNTSPSGVYTDVQVTWKPPPSADVENGWIIPFYQLQYKDVNATEWHEVCIARAKLRDLPQPGAIQRY